MSAGGAGLAMATLLALLHDIEKAVTDKEETDVSDAEGSQ